MDADADERAYCLQVATFYLERAIASHARGRWFETSRAHSILRLPDGTHGSVVEAHPPPKEPQTPGLVRAEVIGQRATAIDIRHRLLPQPHPCKGFCAVEEELDLCDRLLPDRRSRSQAKPDLPAIPRPGGQRRGRSEARPQSPRRPSRR
jgi:hypothetical protein